MQDPVGRKSNGVFDALGFEEVIDFWICETRISPEIDARNLALIPRHDRLQNAVPAIGAERCQDAGRSVRGRRIG